MVGRLVEQQQFRRDGERLRQREAFLLAARERADLGVGIEGEAGNHLFGARLISPDAQRFHLVLQVFHAGEQRVVIGIRFRHGV